MWSGLSCPSISVVLASMYEAHVPRQATIEDLLAELALELNLLLAHELHSVLLDHIGVVSNLVIEAPNAAAALAYIRVMTHCHQAPH